MPEPTKLTPAFLGFNPPQFSQPEILQVLAEQYGETGELKALHGERDQNHRLTTPDGRRFVVKISGSLEEPGVVDFQSKALLHLESAAPDLPLPRIRRTRAGGLAGCVADHGGTLHGVRLLTYLPGMPYECSGPPNLLAARAIGRMQGRLCKALATFDHPSARHFMPWDLSAGVLHQDDLWAAARDDSRAVVLHYREHLEESVLPSLKKLRAQVVHNDGHRMNFLVQRTDSDAVSGLIDFGDMVHTQLINEPSVAIASMLENAAADVMVRAASAVIEGFATEYPLREEEIVLLYDVVMARTIMTVLLVDFRLRTEDNPPDILYSTHSTYMRIVATAENVGRDAFTNGFLNACRKSGLDSGSASGDGPANGGTRGR